MHNKEKGRERRGRCARGIPRGIASEAEDGKNAPTGVGEAGDAARSRAVPPPSGRSLELCSGGVEGGRVQRCNHKVQAAEAFN